VFLIQQGSDMPHNIGKMFYYGERPWHKLGTKLNQAATVSEALDYGCWVSMSPVDDFQVFAHAEPA
jgi:hypothetical protein